jgi:hypothetical protein
MINTKSSKWILALVTVVALTMAACDSTPEEVAQTVESLPPSKLAGLAATIEALPPDQLAALEQAAVAAGVPPLSEDEAAAVVATVEAARATATAVGQLVSAGERVNATQMPDEAPDILYFFASAPRPDQAQAGIRYHLNWTTENANRVEIFGHVMENPAEGSWAVYNPSDNWVLWAANDLVWVEQPLQVEPDRDVGGNLPDVRVLGTNILLTFRDPQFVDGDQINVDVNGVRVVQGQVLEGRPISFPVTLQSGANSVAINVQSAGVTPPLVAEVTVSDAVGLPAVQLTRGLNNGETQTFTITAP